MKVEIYAITFLLVCSLGQLPLCAWQSNPFGEIKKAKENSTLNMHLLPEGEFEVSKDQWGDIVRVNMLKIKDWSKVPGVKKAWPMKGFEGVEGMAFHPVISEVKDVDADGTLDIFRRRSEHPGARIERLRYEDGAWSVVAPRPIRGLTLHTPADDGVLRQGRAWRAETVGEG